MTYNTIQYKCYVNNCKQIQVLFLEHSGIFFLNIFDPQLIEFLNSEPTYMKGKFNNFQLSDLSAAFGSQGKIKSTHKH